MICLTSFVYGITISYIGLRTHGCLLEYALLCKHAPRLKILNQDIHCRHLVLKAVKICPTEERLLPQDEAVAIIIGGFCRDVFKELPMEFATEVDQLLSLKLEGSVG